MKKYIKFSIIALSVLFVSCEDKLETFAPGAMTEDVAIQTSADLSYLLNTSYNLLTNRAEAADVSVFTDEVGIGFANGGQGKSTEYIFTMNPGSDLPVSLWTNSYFALARINRVIALADKIAPKDATDAITLKNLKAQALTLRAYAHLLILSYFSTDLKNDSALAGVLADRVFLPEEKTNPRATNGAFYSLIHADLNQAITTFTANPVAFNSVYANIWFAKGLKARAYMYKGDYTNAETFANDVINNSPVKLATQAEYRSLFFSDNQPATSEVIFKLKRTANQNNQLTNLHNSWVSVRPSAAGSPFYEVSRALHNKVNPGNLSAATLSTTIPDVRGNILIAPSSTVDASYQTSANYLQSDRLIINKHGGVVTGSTTWATTATNANNNDFKIMRVSEMYMIKAEARIAAGDLTGAAAAVKAVRDARYGSAQTAPVYTSAQQAWGGVLDERRIEFAFEGYRYLDLKRLGTIANKGIDRDPADYSSSTVNIPAAAPSNLPLTSFKWTLPIPQNEINVNPGIQQNPGY
ncbi:RagB/SusD family nutrient uptake outer membrane protein [Chryseobacterium sp. T20]|uniref:RagB/SusD family nutrient uptake outer membrane protein n=1 Tax=Chryseobacterium sp. T20 TaxID=3395375 RepID=UPI0039BD7CBC